MKAVNLISMCLCLVMMAGCTSMNGAQGPRGPKLVGSGHATEYGQYGEIGVEFSSMGDFVAFVSPSRWKSPIATGGSLSWLNPVAWSDDPGRTGRILLGEAVVAGGVVAAASSGGGGSNSSGSGSIDSGGSDAPSIGSPPSIPSAPPE